MNYSSTTIAGPALHRRLLDSYQSRPLSQRALNERVPAMTRRYEIEWLTANQEIQNRISIGPILPMFEQAFSALSRGSLVQTPDGPVAIEDLRPGMLVDTTAGKPEPIVWKGAITLQPANGRPGLPASHLYRIAEGSFGLSNTMPDLLLGAGARIMRNAQENNPMARMLDITDLCDGFSVIEVTPRTPSRVFHLGLASHSLIYVNDVVLETYHPGHNPQMRMSEEMFDIFLSMFPHIRRLGDFGPMNHLRTDKTSTR